MKRKVIYSSPFVPAEWIDAHGMRPSRITPRSDGSSRHMPGAGMCPYARAFAGSAVADKTAAAVIVTATCDQMRRAADIIAQSCDVPAFLMHVPHTWQTAGAHRLYLAELERLGRFLAGLGGKPPTRERLAEVMLEHDTARAAIRDVSAAPKGVPVALIGGPLLAGHFRIFDLVEKAGGYVALDATETGERTRPAPFDRREVRDDPLRALADAYFGSIPDAFRRPNSGLYVWLKRKLEERGARGIVFWRYIWCDTWHAEAQRMKEWAGLPFIEVDCDEGWGAHRTLSHLQSFLGVLT